MKGRPAGQVYLQRAGRNAVSPGHQPGQRAMHDLVLGFDLPFMIAYGVIAVRIAAAVVFVRHDPFFSSGYPLVQPSDGH